jgi:hypothetical protein
MNSAVDHKDKEERGRKSAVQEAQLIVLVHAISRRYLCERLRSLSLQMLQHGEEGEDGPTSNVRNVPR